MPPLNEQQVKELIRKELGNFILTDKFIFDRLVQFLDGRSIQVGKTTGTKIGTATDQKIAFHNSTPVIQASAISAPDTPSASYVQVEAQSTVNKVNEMITVLQNKGFIA